MTGVFAGDYFPKYPGNVLLWRSSTDRRLPTRATPRPKLQRCLAHDQSPCIQCKRRGVRDCCDRGHHHCNVHNLPALRQVTLAIHPLRTAIPHPRAHVYPFDELTSDIPPTATSYKSDLSVIPPQKWPWGNEFLVAIKSWMEALRWNIELGDVTFLELVLDFEHFSGTLLPTTPYSQFYTANLPLQERARA